MEVGQSSSKSKSVRKNTREDEEIEPLSGNPFFHATLTKTAVRPPRKLVIPVEGTHILPNKKVSATLVRGERAWEMTYLGGGATQKPFDSRWSQFVLDNTLKVGDVCVFEVMASSDTAVTLKVQVLRGDFPRIFPQDKVDGSSKTPIVVD